MLNNEFSHLHATNAGKANAPGNFSLSLTLSPSLFLPLSLYLGAAEAFLITGISFLFSVAAQIFAGAGYIAICHSPFIVPRLPFTVRRQPKEHFRYHRILSAPQVRVAAFVVVDLLRGVRLVSVLNSHSRNKNI